MIAIAVAVVAIVVFVLMAVSGYIDIDKLNKEV